MAESTADFIMDTDIGTDVDDLLALITAWGGGSPPKGITTVYGDTGLRYRLVRAAYQLARRPEPLVLAGAERPLSGRPVFWAGHEGASLTDEFLPAPQPEPEAAAQLLAESERILALGPLTNVSRALQRSGSRVQRVSMMAGDFTGEAEHNIICDVDAAAAVFESGVAVDVIGTDQTNRVRLAADFLDALPSTPIGELVRDEMQRFWTFMNEPKNTPHDALAVLMLDEPEYFSFERGQVSVDRTGLGAGHVHFSADARGPHRIVRDLDAAAVGDRILRRVVAGAKTI